MSRRTLPVIICVVLALALSAGSAFSATSAPSAGPMPSKATWLKATQKAMVGSHVYLDRRVANKKQGEKLAVNLDIDNTSIQSYYAWPKPVPRVLRFAKHANSLGVVVMFNTGRRASTLKPIRKMLTKAGYRWVHVCGRHRGEALSDSKNRCRQSFIDEGYTLVANVGNNPTDFDGVQNYGRAFKLPNYSGRLS